MSVSPGEFDPIGSSQGEGLVPAAVRPAWRARCTAYGLTLGVIAFLIGSFLGCYCAGAFFFAAFCFLGPLLWGTRFTRIAAVVLLLLGSLAAWQNLKLEQAESLRWKEMRSVPEEL